MRRALAIATLVLAGALAAPASANLISVNTSEDGVNGGDGSCSLREAVITSNSNSKLGASTSECAAGSSLRDTIVLPGGTYVLSENVGSQLSITGNGGPLTIAGVGAGSTTITLGTSVLFDSRLFAFTAPGDHIIHDVTISGGRGGFAGGLGGGAIYSNTTLTILRCVLSGNRAGEGFGGGAIKNNGGLTIRDSTFTANTAGPGFVGRSNAGDDGNSGSPGGDGKDAAGFEPPPGPNGGAIESSGDLLVERSVFTGNSAGAGGVGGDGVGGDGGAATAVGASGGKGGAGQGGSGGRGGSGGAIWASSDTTIVDSTITGNSAGSGGDGGTGRGGDGANGFDGGIGAGGAGGRGGSAVGGGAGEGGGGGGVYIDISAMPVAHITGTVINQNTSGRGGSAGTANGGRGGDAGNGVTAGDGGAGGNATGASGGRGGFGGAIDMPGGTQDRAPDLRNDTVTANTTGKGGTGGQATGGAAGHNTPASRGSAAAGVLTGGDGGPGGDGGGIAYGWLTGAHLTVTANSTGDGGAAGGPNGTAGERGLVCGLYGVTPADVANSIVASNQSRGCLFPLQGSHNISFPGATCSSTVADPYLQPLADNGGPTLTQRLGPASAARDTVPATGARCEALDQRGRSRPQGQACDAGAYEAAPPLVVTGDATSVTTTTADLSGSVNPNLRATSHHFEYGPTSAYGSSTSSDSAGAGDVAVAAVTSLSGLTAATTYHYRLVASNADGTTTGEDRTFTTPPPSDDGSGADDTTPPAFRSASLSPSKVRKTATLAFRLTEPARVAAVIEARLPGRRVHGKCVRQTRSNARRPRCTRFVTKARSAIAAHAGANRATLSKLTAGQRLPLGHYRLSLRATDAAGNASPLKRIQFQVVKRR